METHLIGKEIEIIIQEQIKIANYIAEVGDRRGRLMDFIKYSVNLLLTKEVRENLERNVTNMEIKLMRNSENRMEKLIGTDLKKCRYDNTGFGKYQEKSKYYHSGQICDGFLQDGKCKNGSTCKLRHPKICIYWQRRDKECTQAESCKYLHRNFQKENEDDAKNEDSEYNETSDKLENLEAALASKDDEIEKLKTLNTSLSTENEVIKEEVQKYKRIATNMYNELKDLKTERK